MHTAAAAFAANPNLGDYDPTGTVAAVTTSGGIASATASATPTQDRPSPTLKQDLISDTEQNEQLPCVLSFAAPVRAVAEHLITADQVVSRAPDPQAGVVLQDAARHALPDMLDFRHTPADAATIASHRMDPLLSGQPWGTRLLSGHSRPLRRAHRRFIRSAVAAT